MPPRKRAQSAPKTEPEPTDETLPENDDSATPDDAPTAPSGDAETKPARSDLETVEQPCPDCFPGGWPDQAFAVGCTHGSWQRD